MRLLLLCLLLTSCASHFVSYRSERPIIKSQDSTLECLLQLAWQRNSDLKIARLRLLEAREIRRGKEALYYPHIDGSLAAGHAFLSKDLLTHGPFQNTTIDQNVGFFEVGFDVDWEIDLFGRVASEVALAEANVQIAQAERATLWVTLAAEVSRNYFELRGYQERLALLQEKIASLQRSLTLHQELLLAGVEDLENFHTLTAQFQLLLTQAPLLESALFSSLKRLEVLLDTPLCFLKEARKVPEFDCRAVPPSISSLVLRARPDVRKAEAALRAATASVESAVADLFPRLSLTGFLGAISTQLNTLFNLKESGTWLVAPKLLLPLLNSKMLMQDVAINKLKKEEACVAYRDTVLKALEEAETALATYRAREKSFFFLKKTLEEQRASYELTLSLFERGIKSAIEKEQAYQLLLQAQEGVTQGHLDLLISYVALSKAFPRIRC